MALDFCSVGHDPCGSFEYFCSQSELKEAEKQSLDESARLEKEIAEVREMKVSYQHLETHNVPTIHYRYVGSEENDLLCLQKKTGIMTADEYFERHPELKQKFDDEIPH